MPLSDVWNWLPAARHGCGLEEPARLSGRQGNHLSAVPHPMITAFYHPAFAAPIGDHIMPMRKFALVAEGLKERADVRLVRPEPATESDLRRVHTPEYINAVRVGNPRALAESQKFPWSPALFPSVCLTNGGCMAAARHALRDRAAAALASGFHHAHADHGEGFCTFNGLVVAAEALTAADEVQRVAILDLDLHYGNGTAALASKIGRAS